MSFLLTLLLGLPGADAGNNIPPGYRPANRDTLWYDQALFGRINPLGLIDNFRLGYRRRLEVSENVIGRDAYLFAGLHFTVSPAFARAGVFVDVEPVAFLRLAANYQVGGWFGTFDQVASFTGPNVDWSDPALAALGDAGQTSPTWGQLVTLTAQPKFQIGPFAARNTLNVVWQQAEIPAGRTAWYDQLYERLVPNGGWLISNDADVMGVVGKTRFGARYTYSDSFFPEGEEGNGSDPQHRIGPLFAYQFHNYRDRARWDRPTLFVLAQWWLVHPNRAGQTSSQAFPLIALGLAFEGDLLWKGPPGSKDKKKGGATGGAGF